MESAIAIVVLVVTTGIAIVAMLWVRRTAPDGSYFHDGDRAAGVFGVLATGFAVLLGFVVFLAFTSYDSAEPAPSPRPGSWPSRSRPRSCFLRRFAKNSPQELVCYARSVAGVQWDRMEAGTLGEDLNPWAVKLFQHTQEGPIRRPRPSRRRTASGSTNDPTEKKRGATASTVRSA